MVELYLSRGVSLDPRAGSDTSPLAAAIRSGSEPVVRRLLAAGAKPESKGAASTAARHGRLDLLEILFEAGLDPTGAEARFAATTAATSGQAATLNFFLHRGVPLSDADKNFTAWNLERVGLYPDIVAFLRGQRADLDGVPDADEPQYFRQDAPKHPENDWSEEQLEREALQIVESGKVDAEIDRNHDAGSVLLAAIRAEAVSVAQALLDRGARPDPALLIEAARYGLEPLVERLAPGADDRIQGQALVKAAAFGLPAMVRVLLRAGADPAAKDDGGQTAFVSASGPYREEIQALLRKANAERGGTPGAALTCVGKPRTRVARLRGARELVKTQTAIHPSWTVLAFRLPIEELAPRLTAVYGARIETDVAKRGVEPNPNGVFLLQLAGHPWTMELRALGFHWRGRLHIEANEALEISKSTDSEVVLCSGSDASQTFGLTHCERGVLRMQKEWDLDEARQSDDAFAALELFLPGCRVDTSGFGARLELDRIDPSAVARLDYIIFAES